MVKFRWLIMLLANSVASAASLTAHLDKPVVALGEAISLTVQAKSLKLDTLDITPLAENFDVFARTLSRGPDHETLVLTLYPRATGTLPIPALQLDTLRTPALLIKVSDGNETVSRVTVNWTLNPVSSQLNSGRPNPGQLNQSWVNQPTRLTLAICDDGSLQWQRPSLPTFRGRLLRPLGEGEGAGERAGEPCVLHQFHWSFIATQSGPATLNVPMLDANRFGQRLRFPAPGLTYPIVALPTWLPAHVPTVAPQISTHPLPSRWPVQRPLAWRFQVTGGYSAEGLKALLDLQVRESPALGIYPSLIQAVALEDSASPLTRYNVTLFLQPRASGPLILPMLRLPWYDVTRGKIAKSVVEGKKLTIFDPRWKRGGQIAGGLAGVLLLGASFWQLRRMAGWRLARWRGLRTIRQARSVEALAQAVRQFSLTGQTAAPSLGEWVRRLQQEAPACDVTEGVSQLEQQQFGRAALNLAELQQAFLWKLKRAHPKSPF